MVFPSSPCVCLASRRNIRRCLLLLKLASKSLMTVFCVSLIMAPAVFIFTADMVKKRHDDANWNTSSVVNSSEQYFSYREAKLLTSPIPFTANEPKLRAFTNIRPALKKDCENAMELPKSNKTENIRLIQLSKLNYYIYYYTGLFLSPSVISELDCATTKTDAAQRSISIGRESLECRRNLITGLTSAASPKVHISRTCKVGQKLGEILYLLICSFLPRLSWLWRSRIQKSRRDLGITLYNIHTLTAAWFSSNLKLHAVFVWRVLKKKCLHVCVFTCRQGIKLKQNTKYSPEHVLRFYISFFATASLLFHCNATNDEQVFQSFALEVFRLFLKLSSHVKLVPLRCFLTAASKKSYGAKSGL